MSLSLVKEVTMYYGVEQSTDMRNKMTTVKRFYSKRALLRWMDSPVGFTHADPEAAGNYHHSFRYGYYLEGKIDWKDPIFKSKGTRDYPLTKDDLLATYLRVYGKEIELEDE